MSTDKLDSNARVLARVIGVGGIHDAYGGSMSPDTIVLILQFAVAILSLALATSGIVPAQFVPWIQFAIAVLTAALGIFFGVKKPIATARAMAAASSKK